MSISFGATSIITDGLVISLDPSTIKYDLLREAQVLVVGGGGAGGFGHGGGGGGGAVLYNPNVTIVPGKTYTITVGTGGTSPVNNSQYYNGSHSYAFGGFALGGGAGANENGDDTSGRNAQGSTGGNNGGNSYNRPSSPAPITYNNPGWIVSAGNTGGASYFGSAFYYGCGGGGGAGSPGEYVTSALQGGGRGGDGVPNDILGTVYYWGAGGGGASYGSSLYKAGDGGFGGGGGASFDGDGTAATAFGRGGIYAYNSGGNGQHGTDLIGGAGGANTGSGGGSGSNENGPGGPGGSGIVVVKYAGPQKATGGDEIIHNNGHTIHIFKNSGTFTPFSSNSSTTGSSVYGIMDYSGTGSHLNQKSGSPTYNTDGGGSLTFNGSSYLLGSSNPINKLSVFSDLTAEAWVKITGSPGDWVLVWGKMDNGGGNRTWGLWYNVNYDSGRWLYQRSGSSGFNVFSSSTISYNTWVHMVGVSDGETQKLYINGTLSNSTTTTNSQFVDNNSEFTMGYGRVHTYHQGLISICRLYNRALTDSEVQNNFNVTRHRFGI